MRIDAHQHFWQFNPQRDRWITDDMAVIRNDYMPEDLQPLLQENGFDGCIAIEAAPSEAQTDFLVALASQFSYIKGVVGWVDLQVDTISSRLEHFSQYKIIKGFRHALQGEPRRNLMLSPAFIRGMAALEAFNFTYDLLIFPDQLIYSKYLAARFPEQKFVIDHLAKPFIRKGEIKEWTLDMEAIAKLPNVWCKLSGMVTEANWKTWRKEDLRPYINVVVESFGIDRILFGSDWPVCQLAASYGEVVEIVRDYFSAFSPGEQQKVFGGNATNFYSL